ncbi:MAG: DUF3285 domain-containing protein [Elainellaceae cyanobacterium]
MSKPDVASQQSTQPPTASPAAPSDPAEVTAPTASVEPAPSYVKLAMRNMVRKGGKSLFHFSLTVSALLGLLIGLSYLTR